MAATTNYLTLVRIAMEAGLLDERPAHSVIDENYSGRGMYGRTCVGFRLDNSGQMIDLGRAMATMLEVDELDEWGSASTDGMGLGIIAYFIGVQCTDAPDEEDGEYEDEDDSDDDS